MKAINYLIISYFGAVLFPVDLVTKRAMLEVARRASSLLFSPIFLRLGCRSIASKLPSSGADCEYRVKLVFKGICGQPLCHVSDYHLLF